MTADVELLLPLPEWAYGNNHLRIKAAGLQSRVTDYARACVAHATAAKDVEIERLRAEREVIGAEALKYAGKSGRLEAKVDRLADALREAMEWNWIDGDVPDAIQVKARDALRDHDQEVGE